MYSSEMFNKILCFLLAITFANVSLARTLTIGWELWYPYQFHNKDSQLVGLDFDVMNAILAEAKLKGEYTELPWLRHLKYIESGEFDVAMGTSYSKERESYAYYSVPYRTETVHLFVRTGRKETIKLDTLSDLIGSPYFIGVEEGYYYGENYKSLIKNPNFAKQISEVFDIEQSVQMTLQGSIDGFLADPQTVKSFVDKYRLENVFEQHSLEIYSDNIHIIMSRKSVDKTLFEQVNNALKSLKERGELDKIYQKWQ